MKTYGIQAAWKTALSPWVRQSNSLFNLFVAAIAGFWKLGGQS